MIKKIECRAYRNSKLAYSSWANAPITIQVEIGAYQRLLNKGVYDSVTIEEWDDNGTLIMTYDLQKNLTP